jgi:hypothetical protein
MRKPKRGFFGALFKWTFILFNVLMLWWMVSALGIVGENMANTTGDLEAAGAAIGSAIGFGMILSIWTMGDIILGLLVLFTRPKRG